jgi:two-component sensor histidine kinase
MSSSSPLHQIRNTLINQLYHLRSLADMPASEVDNETIASDLRDIQAVFATQQRRIHLTIAAIEDLIYQRCPEHSFVQDSIDFVESSRLIYYCEHCGLEPRG